MSESTTPIPHQPDTFAHTILAAICVVGPGTRRDAELWLHDHLPRTQSNLINPEQHPMFVDAWWIAEDDRHDGSDNDSAVFLYEPWRAAGMTQEVADILLGLCDRLARSQAFGNLEGVVEFLRDTANRADAPAGYADQHNTQEGS